MTVQYIVKHFRNRMKALLGENLVAVYWFGSSSRGQPVQGYDIDLLVETSAHLTDKQRDQACDIAIDLCAEFGLLLDVHYYTTEEITELPYSHSPFVESATKEGIRA